MKYNITLTLTVDPDAPFLEVDRGTNLSIVRDLLWNTLYDIDDIQVEELEVYQDE